MESSYIWTKKDDMEFNKELNIDISQDSIFKNYGSVVRVKVLAKNGMGGYVSDNIECPLVNNKFDEFEQTLYSLQVSIMESCANLVASRVHTPNIDEYVKKNCSKK